MKLIALATVALALAWPVGAVQAQAADKNPAAAKSAPAKKAPAKASSQKKTSTQNSTTAKRRVPAKTAKAVEANTPVTPITAHLSAAQLGIAQLIHTGKIQCELGADVTVKEDEKAPGFFLISSGKRRYYMYPVESRTGALRLEDGRAGAMWLQLGNKSMLMDQKAGQRVADECVADPQRVVADHMKANPVPGLLDDLKK